MEFTVKEMESLADKVLRDGGTLQEETLATMLLDTIAQIRKFVGEAGIVI